MLLPNKAFMAQLCSCIFLLCIHRLYVKDKGYLYFVISHLGQKFVLISEVSAFGGLCNRGVLLYSI